ncbi:putative rta1 domain protein [Zalerion maritima]|uniref:Rta1 domain protein n=1 Tax=Zalerion maritima TaxID=339359 RepID=A0AAD5WQ19_9PEZI|nr:putative rta1 domain protein [Zalerion maritima]
MAANSSVTSYYQYDPSTEAAIVVAVLYGLSFGASVFQTIKDRAWAWLVMSLAIGMELVGFIFRIKSSKDVSDRIDYIIQFCLIILSPVLMAAAIYVIFGRVVFHIVPQHARSLKLLWIPPRFVTPIFVGFDVIALFLQTIGAIMVSSTQATDGNAKEKMNRGKDLAMSGIAVQMAAFGLFTIVAARFQFTSKRFAHDVTQKLLMEPGEKTASVPGSRNKIKPNWRVILFSINLSCVLILLRSIYRMIEFDEGKTGETASHEWYMYVFDVVPMLIVCLSFNLSPPGRYLPFMGVRIPKSERGIAISDDEAQQMELQPGSSHALYPNADHR